MHLSNLKRKYYVIPGSPRNLPAEILNETLNQIQDDIVCSVLRLTEGRTSLFKGVRENLSGEPPEGLRRANIPLRESPPHTFRRLYPFRSRLIYPIDFTEISSGQPEKHLVRISHPEAIQDFFLYQMPAASLHLVPKAPCYTRQTALAVRDVFQVGQLNTVS